MKFAPVLAAAAALCLRPIAADDGSKYDTAETVYLANQSINQDGNILFQSIMAYYASPWEVDPVNFSNYPNDTAVVVSNGNAVWEEQQWSGTFTDTGVTFTSNIDANAASLAMNQPAGTGSNGYRSFDCFKGAPANSPPLKIYEDDNVAMFGVYWCFARAP